MSDNRTFDLLDPLPINQWLLLEASAGTGKTYSLTALVVRYVVEYDLRPEELLMVTFTRAAAAEMKQEVREQLLRARSAFDRADDADLEPWLLQLAECSDDERRVRRERLDHAISAIDLATISTIHGFFQQALADVGIRSGESSVVPAAQRDTAITDRVIRDVLIREFAEDSLFLDPSQVLSPETIERKVHSVFGAVSRNQEAVPAPSLTPPGSSNLLPEAVRRFIASFTGVGFDEAEQWSSLAERLRREIKSARVEQDVVSFDDLILDLIQKIADPVLGPEIVRTLRTRFRLVLIDEFQDTDSTQWKLFSEVFALEDATEHFLAMILVGDPKQAIYRFRGADIDAYMAASKSPSLAKRQMTTNFRTDQPLVAALNRWLTGVTFGDPSIPYIPVQSPKHLSSSRLVDGGTPLQFRFLPNPNEEKVAAVRSALALDLADHVQALLSHGMLQTDPANPASVRPVRLRDICILVRGHDDAGPIQSELRRRNIPSVRGRIGSVLESESIRQLRILFFALSNPGDARRVRALQAGWFAPHSSPSDPVDDLQMKCRTWSIELEARGLIGWFQLLRLDDEVVQGISSSFEAERRLTDLEHVIELLNMHVGGRRVSALTAFRSLEELADEIDHETESQKRRIDTDRDVIEITTMHSSKGLEYPIVLLPFPRGTRKSTYSVYRNRGTRFVDCAPDVPWVLNGLRQDERLNEDLVEAQADDLRLLYVALTRAKHQLVIWWGRSESDTSLNGPLARILFGSSYDLGSSLTISDELAGRRIFDLVDRIAPDVSFTEISKWSDDREWIEDQAPSHLTFESAAFPEHDIERDGWYRWSYSSLSKGARSNNEGAARGGTDEAPGGRELGVDGRPETFTGPLLGMQASADFGTFVHELFEALDLGSPDVDAEVRTVIDRSGRAEMFNADPELLAEGLVLAIDTPFGAQPDGPSLRAIGSQRLNEMVFHFPLADGNTAVAPHQLFELAASHRDDEFSDYFSALADGNRLPAMAGLMTGSIDSVVRFGDTADASYGVIDYKTNRLHVPGDIAPIAAYGYESMKQAMEHGDYPLQILVYNVALHRMLQQRLPEYDIDRHIGTTHYLFVRGMIGSDTPVVDGRRNGVFAWRPSSELILAASRLLGGQS
jgi:exodeoxyribonuclease V beta subunit